MPDVVSRTAPTLPAPSAELAPARRAPLPLAFALHAAIARPRPGTLASILRDYERVPHASTCRCGPCDSYRETMAGRESALSERVRGGRG